MSRIIANGPLKRNIVKLPSSKVYLPWIDSCVNTFDILYFFLLISFIFRSFKSFFSVNLAFCRLDPTVTTPPTPLSVAISSDCQLDTTFRFDFVHSLDFFLARTSILIFK